MATLQDERAIDEEWVANSYEGSFLDVYGEKHPVIFDPRLRDAVSPFIPRSFWKKILGPLER